MNSRLGPDAYANTFFILGMIKRLLREWMGLHGHIISIKNLRMHQFNCVGDVIEFKGTVRGKLDDGVLVIDISCETEKGVTVTAEARLSLPEIKIPSF